MDERDRLRRILLFVLIGFVLLLYCLAAVSLWVRKQFLGSEILNTLPTGLPFAVLLERIF